MERYNHKAIEAKWQERFDKEKIFFTRSDDARPRSYVLDMFPYPSAQGLHVGHPEGYTATDIYARYLRLKGINVLHPIGWDAFGLPAENYAIKTGRHPSQTTTENIANMKRQIKSLGFSYDWSRELSTAAPSYYRWTQWLFLQFYKKGLAYRAEAPVNWCPGCQTVLANEQVADGACERCGAIIEQRQMKQWFFKITDYAERLLNDLAKLDWPEAIVDMQRNWIGKSAGAAVSFYLKDPRLRRFVLLHGRSGSPEKNFFPWLAERIKKAGYDVQMPKLPNSAEPNIEEQVDYVQNNCTLDDETVVVGHSFGGVVALRLMELGQKLGKVILVSTPISGNFLDNKPRPSVKSALESGFNFSKIKNQAYSFVVLSDKYDEVVPINDGRILARQLDTKPIEVKAMEKHFCGKEEPHIVETCAVELSIFTTRLDTIFGATFMVVSPELARRWLEAGWQASDEVKSYINEVLKGRELERLARAARDKTGVDSGLKAVNPATGEEISVWLADYVLGSYGTGAIMAVPAHDERDYAFAKKFGLPIKQVIMPHIIDQQNLPRQGKKNTERVVVHTVMKHHKEEVFTGAGVLCNSDEFSGLESAEATKKIAAKIGAQLTVQYKLHDWLISRQRYWGAPIPIIYCEQCGEMPVPESDLPVWLPQDVDFRPTGESPLARSQSFQKVVCPKCGRSAKRESDTMDTFVDSSWYWLRYCDPHNEKEIFAKKKVKSWCPVNLYVGGAEHAVMHLLYARFFTKVLYDLGYIDFTEPFLKLRNQGLILGEDGQKMSKSRGNVINPDDIIARYGADTLRLYEMFMGPLEDFKPWHSASIIGVRRFLERVGNLAEQVAGNGLTQSAGAAPSQLAYYQAQTISRVTRDIENFRFNTAIAALMEFTNVLLSETKVDKAARLDGLKDLLVLLYPFAPHFSCELWERLKFGGDLWQTTWPAVKETNLQLSEIKIVIQVNGRVRASLSCSRAAGRAEVTELAKNSAAVAKYLSGKDIKRVIYVAGRLINFVTE